MTHLMKCWNMISISSLAESKMELEGRIKGLEEEKSTLVSEISTLREKLENLRLRRTAKSLEQDVSRLRAEKTGLEEEVAQNILQEQQTSLIEPNNNPAQSATAS